MYSCLCIGSHTTLVPSVSQISYLSIALCVSLPLSISLSVSVSISVFHSVSLIYLGRNREVGGTGTAGERGFEEQRECKGDPEQCSTGERVKGQRLSVQVTWLLIALQKRGREESIIC